MAVVVVTMSVFIGSTAHGSMALDAPVGAALHEDGADLGKDALMTGARWNNCGHDAADLGCPSCSACWGISASAPVAMPSRVFDADAEYTSHLENVVPRCELPPPKHA